MSGGEIIRERARAGCPYVDGNEFAAAIIEAVLPQQASYSHPVIYSPEEAQGFLPHLTEVDKRKLNKTDQEVWSDILMQRGWSHESRTMIVIAKSKKPLSYWLVKETLEEFERKGELEGWLPYA